MMRAILDVSVKTIETYKRPPVKSGISAPLMSLSILIRLILSKVVSGVGSFRLIMISTESPSFIGTGKTGIRLKRAVQ